MNSAVKEYLESILDNIDLDEQVSAMVSSFLEDGDLGIDLNDFQEMEDEDHDKAYLKALGSSFSMEDEDLKCLIENENLRSIELNPATYSSDSFYQLTSGLRGHSGTLHLSSNTFYPLEGFLADDVKSIGPGNSIECNTIGYFKEPFKYLVLRDENTLWMTSTPYEMNTMKEAIAEAVGNVLCLGLGLGYFAYSAAIKPEVKKVVVIENDPRVIEIYNRLIAPRLQDPKFKIEVIQADAFSYLKENKEEGWDYIFADLWHNEKDGIPLYFRLLALIDKKKKASYWMEPSMLAYLRRGAVFGLYDSIEGNLTSRSEANEWPEGYYEFYEAYSQKKFETIEDIEDSLTDEKLKETGTEVGKGLLKAMVE